MSPLVVLVAAAALSAAPAPAKSPAVSNPHIRAVTYDPDQLVSLHGDLGFQMVVEFSPDEHIENVSIGDGLAWQITPNKRANLLFLKPLDASVLTNMTVVTDQRRYAFELDVNKTAGRKVPNRTYVVHFNYPMPAVTAPPAPAAKAAPERRNTRFSYSGGKGLLPSDVFDDGRFTYFRWPDTTPTPAIFAIGGEGGETLVNYGVRDGFVIVEQTSPRFVLRNGVQQTTVYNDGWRDPDPGPGAPRPHARADANPSSHETSR